MSPLKAIASATFFFFLCSGKVVSGHEKVSTFFFSSLHVDRRSPPLADPPVQIPLYFSFFPTDRRQNYHLKSAEELFFFLGGTRTGTVKRG